MELWKLVEHAAVIGVGGDPVVDSDELARILREQFEATIKPLQSHSAEILRPVDYDDTRLDPVQKEKVRYIEGQIEGIHKAAEALGIELYSDQQPNV